MIRDTHAAGDRHVNDSRGGDGSAARDGAPVGDDPRLVAVVPRLVRSAFGLALGAVGGVGLALLATVHALIELPGEDPLFVWLLGHSFLPGYEPTLRGAVAGLVWGLILGFSLGWFVAFARDVFLRVTVTWIARRERLRAHGRVLDDLI